MCLPKWPAESCPTVFKSLLVWEKYRHHYSLGTEQRFVFVLTISSFRFHNLLPKNSLISKLLNFSRAKISPFLELLQETIWTAVALSLWQRKGVINTQMRGRKNSASHTLCWRERVLHMLDRGPELNSSALTLFAFLYLRRMFQMVCINVDLKYFWHRVIPR